MLKMGGKLLSIIFVAIMISPLVVIADDGEVTGFDKGVSYMSVVPLRKVTFVGFDEDGFLDDYAYLAAVPTSVFSDGSRLFSYPLLFYQDSYPVGEDRERSLDARKGLDYFMEDWMGYCNGRLDGMTLINVPKEKVKQWPSRNTTIINGDNPYDIASQIALHDWSYSDAAVVAVINESFTPLNIETHGEIKGVIPSGYTVKEMSFNMKQPNIGVGGCYQEFEIKEPYKYIVANMDWKNPAIDLDLQIYDDQLGMTDASSKWNIFYGAGETVGSYVYHHGIWEIGVTYMPTQYLVDGKMKSMFQNVDDTKGLSSILGLKRGETVEVKLYPGVIVDLNKTIPFDCRDVEFKLKWNNPSISLGMAILDPSGVETITSPSKDEIIEGINLSGTERVIHLDKLGETTDGENYSICIFSLNDTDIPIDFTMEYSWKQMRSREEGDCLAAAAEGSILASILNTPMLYMKLDSIPDITLDTLYKLGVKKIHLLNLGGHASSSVINELKDLFTVDEYTEYRDIYDKIRGFTGRNDVVFTTIDPWNYWYVGELKPAGEYKGALFIGPATYIAAHHGVPVLIVDNHPVLSQSVVWHQKFWLDTSHLPFRPALPSVAIMFLTGNRVIKFLEDLGYNLPKDKDDLETMITVCDQFEIGPTWDRTFVGRLLSGRFIGSPVDTAYWINRNIFYPSLIFENPALSKNGVNLINGSRSIIRPYIGKLLPPRGTDLVIIKPSQEEKFIYPVLHTYNVHLKDFNKIGSKHWGGIYTCANGIIPYETSSPYSIDEGVTDKSGAYYPDIDTTDVTPIYADKAGYSNVFSTNFTATTYNLNKGVIMWIEAIHGGNLEGGTLGMWNPNSPYVDEPNPWRGYERILLSPRNWNEFIQYLPELLEKEDIHIPKIVFAPLKVLTFFLNLLIPDKGCTENPDVAVTNPEIIPSTLVDALGVDLHIKESHGLSLIPILGRSFRSYHDGIVIDPLPGGENVLMKYNGLDFDDVLENIHSCGINAASCLISNTYLHLAFIRHGAVYQILDPWSTSWYSNLWIQSIPRDLALGYKIGEAYEHGMAMVGVEYLVNQWWWDLNENVVFFGDPDLRVWTPNTRYSDANHWSYRDVQPMNYDPSFNIDGHSPFGVTSYPHETSKPLLSKFYILVLLLVILIILVSILFLLKEKNISEE